MAVKKVGRTGQLCARPIATTLLDRGVQWRGTIKQGVFLFLFAKHQLSEMGVASTLIGGAMGFGVQLYSNTIQKIPLSRRM